MRERGLDADAIARLVDGARLRAAAADRRRARAARPRGDLDGAPPHVAGDYPEWLDPYLARVFGDERAEEGAALASRAPLDLRVNTLKADRDEALRSRWPISRRSRRAGRRMGLRIELGADAKSPAIHAESGLLKGLIEIQDEGSQLAALLAGAKPGEQVLDLCAGGGGKTLALAAAMENKGQLYATDDDKRRLAPIHDRLDARRRAQRPGAHAEVGRQRARRPRRQARPRADRRALHRHRRLAAQPGRQMAGAARARWSMRVKEQAEVLDRAVPLVKPGGRIAYVTCSVLDEENGAQVREFLARHPDFSVEKPAEVAKALGERAYMFGKAALVSDEGLLMTPRRTDTDGFFVSVLRRSA